VDDRDRAALKLLGWIVGLLVASYLVTRPVVRAKVKEHLPSHEQINAVLRRAEQITRQAAEPAGKDGNGAS
jgi:hypothetical protein